MIDPTLLTLFEQGNINAIKQWIKDNPTVNLAEFANFRDPSPFQLVLDLDREDDDNTKRELLTLLLEWNPKPYLFLDPRKEVNPLLKSKYLAFYPILLQLNTTLQWFKDSPTLIASKILTVILTSPPLPTDSEQFKERNKLVARLISLTDAIQHPPSNIPQSTAIAGEYDNKSRTWLQLFSRQNYLFLQTYLKELTLERISAEGRLFHEELSNLSLIGDGIYSSIQNAITQKETFKEIMGSSLSENSLPSGWVNLNLINQDLAKIKKLTYINKSELAKIASILKQAFSDFPPINELTPKFSQELEKLIETTKHLKISLPLMVTHCSSFINFIKDFTIQPKAETLDKLKTFDITTLPLAYKENILRILQKNIQRPFTDNNDQVEFRRLFLEKYKQISFDIQDKKLTELAILITLNKTRGEPTLANINDAKSFIDSLYRARKIDKNDEEYLLGILNNIKIEPKNEQEKREIDFLSALKGSKTNPRKTQIELLKNLIDELGPTHRINHTAGHYSRNFHAFLLQWPLLMLAYHYKSREAAQIILTKLSLEELNTLLEQLLDETRSQNEFTQGSRTKTRYSDGGHPLPLATFGTVINRELAHPTNSTLRGPARQTIIAGYIRQAIKQKKLYVDFTKSLLDENTFISKEFTTNIETQFKQIIQSQYISKANIQTAKERLLDFLTRMLECLHAAHSIDSAKQKEGRSEIITLIIDLIDHLIEECDIYLIDHLMEERDAAAWRNTLRAFLFAVHASELTEASSPEDIKRIRQLLNPINLDSLTPQYYQLLVSTLAYLSKKAPDLKIDIDLNLVNNRRILPQAELETQFYEDFLTLFSNPGVELSQNEGGIMNMIGKFPVILCATYLEPDKIDLAKKTFLNFFNSQLVLMEDENGKIPQSKQEAFKSLLDLIINHILFFNDRELNDGLQAIKLTLMAQDFPSASAEDKQYIYTKLAKVAHHPSPAEWEELLKRAVISYEKKLHTDFINQLTKGDINLADQSSIQNIMTTLESFPAILQSLFLSARETKHAKEAFLLFFYNALMSENKQSMGNEQRDQYIAYLKEVMTSVQPDDNDFMSSLQLLRYSLKGDKPTEKTIKLSSKMAAIIITQDSKQGTQLQQAIRQGALAKMSLWKNPENGSNALLRLSPEKPNANNLGDDADPEDATTAIGLQNAL